MDTNKYLPIGTVVMLKNGKKKLMITGYTSIDIEKKEQVFDYSGCLYPEGTINNSVFLFNNEDIKNIYFIGYNDAEGKKFQKILEELDRDKILKKIEE